MWESSYRLRAFRAAVHCLEIVILELRDHITVSLGAAYKEKRWADHNMLHCYKAILNFVPYIITCL
jgi:hypothetical protein